MVTTQKTSCHAERVCEGRVSARPVCLIAFWIVLRIVGETNWRVSAAEPTFTFPKKHHAMLQQHCDKCHNADKMEGKFRVDLLEYQITTLESVERWQKVLNALNSNSMPPEGAPQPDRQAKADFLDDLANLIVAARRNLFDQHGVKTLRRLNRREYRNSLRELLGVEIGVNELPSDTGTGGFDTLATNLFMSSNQFEQYLALSREALDDAFERAANVQTVKKQRFEAEDAIDKVRANLQDRLDQRKKYVQWSRAVDHVAERPENRLIAAQIKEGMKNQPPWNFYHSWKKLTGAPTPTEFGFVDAETATHIGNAAINLLPYQAYFLVQPETKTGAFLTIRDNGVLPMYSFPVGGDWMSGEYLVRIRIAATKQPELHRRFVEFGVHATHLSTHEVLGTMDAPQVIEVKYNLTKNRTGSFFLREKGTFDSNEQAHRVFAEGEKRNGIGPEFALWVDWTEVERIANPDNRLPRGLAALGIPLVDVANPLAINDVRAALERFGEVACRGQRLPHGFIDRLICIYDRRRGEGASHSSALKETLSVVLSSARFIYLSEPPTTEGRDQLSDQELAVRLAFFLWGAPPDAELGNVAARGDLARPEILERQMNRLIEDVRCDGMITPFIHQWLGLDRLDFFKFNNVRYPAFDESTRMAARNEVYETFGYLLRKNESLLNLLSSEFVVVNGLLANFYGIDDVHGDDYRKVILPAGSPRGGLLGMAAIMAMGGNGERTSPVERGAWVLRKLLNDPPPPAPANVPQISRLDDQLLTTRERLLAHQEQPQCASCHRKIDPLGLGLENFNAVGQWRTDDDFETPQHARKRWAIDASGAIHNGPEFKDYFELKQIIASKSEPFTRGFSIALLEYALGRPYSYSDEPLINRMIEHAGQKTFATRQFIHQLVQSDQFRRR